MYFVVNASYFICFCTDASGEFHVLLVLFGCFWNPNEEIFMNRIQRFGRKKYRLNSQQATSKKEQ